MDCVRFEPIRDTHNEEAAPLAAGVQAIRSAEPGEVRAAALAGRRVWRASRGEAGGVPEPDSGALPRDADQWVRLAAWSEGWTDGACGSGGLAGQPGGRVA